MSELANRALQVAITQIGKEEIPRGSNWGEHVQKYLNSVGINFQAAWCMAFLYWCFKQAGMVKQLPKTGGCLAMLHTVDKQYIVKKPEVGAIVVWDHGKGLGHVGIVERVDGDKMYTIEGNTNNDGSREGYAVERKVRKIADPKIIGYVLVS